MTIDPSLSGHLETTDGVDAVSHCTDLVPFMSLLRVPPGWSNLRTPLSVCMELYQVDVAVSYYLEAFVGDWKDAQGIEPIRTAFTAAVFIANEAWTLHLTGSDDHDAGTLHISRDMGVDAPVPHMSSAGIVVISTLLGFYALSLLAATLYCWANPSWTDRLDSLAMLRLGAASPTADERSSGRLPLIKNKEELAWLDDMPGWVGDATEGDGHVGDIVVGATTRLNAKRRYRCVPADHDPVSARDAAASAATAYGTAHVDKL